MKTTFQSSDIQKNQRKTGDAARSTSMKVGWEMNDTKGLLGESMKKGEKYQILFGPERTPTLIHIRAIVDDSIIVYRTWSSRKQTWNYQVNSLYYFDLLKSGNRLIKQ